MADPLDVKAYLAEVRSALIGLPTTERDEAVADLEANLGADVERRGGNKAAEYAAIADLGTPAEYAAAVREALGADSLSPQPQGRVLGMPYEFRSPTAGRVMERIWNPADPRVMMPRTWGVGWTVNFGAIAVRLGLARPDDLEERPFENLSSAAVSAAVAVPVFFGLVAAGLGLAFFSRMPARVPVHFNGAGVADGWGPKTLAIGIPVAVALGLPVLVLGWRMARGSSRGTIAIASTILAFSGALSTVIVGYTVANVVAGVTGWWLGLLVLATLAVPAAMFYGLARASLKKEWSAAATAIKRKEMPR